MNATAELGQLLDALGDAIERGADQTRLFLASPAGRRVRSLTASALSVSRHNSSRLPPPTPFTTPVVSCATNSPSITGTRQ